MARLSPVWKRRLKIGGAVLLVLAAVIGFTAWYKLFREEPERAFASDGARFMYGSIGAEGDSGLPYWIWIVLPRVFPDYLPGPGGYRSFGLPWEEGEEMPVGFTKKVIGFPRVANNCAICHTAVFRLKQEETPRFVPSGPNHTFNTQGFLRFLTRCAKDERFNADTLLTEIRAVTELSLLDRMLYRYLIIPMTRKAILRREGQLAWMNRPHMPDWGPGRDDPMNLTKYFMTNLPWDDTTGNADFPSVWNLKIREGGAKTLNWDGATPSPRSVIIDSALGLGAANDRYFLDRMKWIEDFLKATPPPKYPFPVDAQLVSRGKTLFDANCHSCHGLAEGTRLATVIPIEEIGTDRNRLDTWTQQGADIANATVARMGIQRIGLQKTNGYAAVPLDGVWLRAPYLHNGSVPSVRDLLKTVEQRPKEFYRGYDLYDPMNVGFDSQSAEARRIGYRFDTSQRGNGNHGHVYGTALPEADKNALVEYLKTL
jgi:mono/diheme cytochrome c family protein